MKILRNEMFITKIHNYFIERIIKFQIYIYNRYLRRAGQPKLLRILYRPAAIISATSITATSFSFSLFFTPSVSIVLQNGQAEAIIFAPVFIASSLLSMFT